MGGREGIRPIMGWTPKWATMRLAEPSTFTRGEAIREAERGPRAAFASHRGRADGDRYLQEGCLEDGGLWPMVQGGKGSCKGREGHQPRANTSPRAPQGRLTPRDSCSGASTDGALPAPQNHTQCGPRLFGREGGCPSGPLILGSPRCSSAAGDPPHIHQGRPVPPIDGAGWERIWL